MKKYDDSNYGIEKNESVMDTFLGKIVYGKYFKTINDYINIAKINETILDIGCAEGDTLYRMRNNNNNNFDALDISDKMIKISEKINPNVTHIQGSIYDAPFKDNDYKMVVCSEVLEHLDQPEVAFKEIHRITNEFALISVPNEPYFSIANLIRLRHLKSFGNTPGHIQRFSKRDFINLINRYFEIVKISTCFGIWNIALCKKIKKQKN